MRTRSRPSQDLVSYGPYLWVPNLARPMLAHFRVHIEVHSSTPKIRYATGTRGTNTRTVAG